MTTDRAGHILRDSYRYQDKWRIQKQAQVNQKLADDR
jgi:hypothetical protein